MRPVYNYAIVMQMEDLKAGVYKHYKGGLYMLLGQATHSETGEQLIAYVQLSGKQGSKIWVRPYDSFVGEVTVDGVRKPRFGYLGMEIPDTVAAWYDPVGGYSGADRDDG